MRQRTLGERLCDLDSLDLHDCLQNIGHGVVA
jgi:hypothetical protein